MGEKQTRVRKQKLKVTVSQKKFVKMSAFRRPRIKASVTHLASLAGKRRVVVNNLGNEESQTNNNEVTKNKETPLVNNINVPNLENNEKSLVKIEKVPDGQI